MQRLIVNSNLRARVIAFYLPQFHPIPENDKWWGKGFTEWTNVGKAKPLFEGHYQPKVPSDLGYYDLRVAETRKAQADMAREYGIEAFCYWHYWFGNAKQLLERPFQEVVKSGEPDFPFCLGWANQTWSGIWHGAPNRILIEQKYPGLDDYKAHFYSLLEAFKDERYMKINGKLVFLIYNPADLPSSKEFIEYWQELAKKENISEFYFIAHMSDNAKEYYCDRSVDNAPFTKLTKPVLTKNKFLKVFEYCELVQYLDEYVLKKDEYPLIIPNWDNTPRSESQGLVLKKSTPELFTKMVRNAIDKVQELYPTEERIIFLKAWNEWAEGNYMEPDLKYGHEYLKALKNALIKV